MTTPVPGVDGCQCVYCTELGAPELCRGYDRPDAPALTDGEGSLDVVGNIVWWKEGGVSFYPASETFSVDRSCKVEPVVGLAQAESERDYWIKRHAGALTAAVQTEIERDESCADLEAQASAYKERVEMLEAELERVREAATTALQFLQNAPLESGICCCGDPISGHNISSGHSPVDDLAYHSDQISKGLRTALNREG